MVTATWNDVVIARSDRTVVVEGNHYVTSVRAPLATAVMTQICVI
jgi:uncharacterized protein (DUF427 family)